MEQLLKLKTGAKYTLVGFSEFGFPYQVQMILSRIVIEPYAQYPVSYLLIFKQQGKRKERQIRFYDMKKFIVWEGWVYPNTEMYVSRSLKDYESGPVEISKSWVCFDQRYLTCALLSVDREPFIQSLYYPQEVRPVSGEMNFVTS